MMAEQYDRARNFVGNYGPAIMGAVVIALVLILGIWFWRSRVADQNSESSIVMDTQEATPSPSPAPGQIAPSAEVLGPTGTTPTPVGQKGSSGQSTTKGGQELPQTGVPGAILAFSLASVGAGLILKRLRG